jgi:hypothetical protein
MREGEQHECFDSAIDPAGKMRYNAVILGKFFLIRRVI